MNDWHRYETAVAAGWKPTRPKRFVDYPCRGGCGRVFTSAGQDEVHSKTRMHSYLCLDCRKSISAFLARLRRESKGKKAMDLLTPDGRRLASDA